MAVVETAQGRQASALARRVRARLLRQVEEMVALVDVREGQEGTGRTEAELRARAEEVSGWSVAEHLEHLTLVDRGILDRIDGLLAGSPPSPVGGINAAGRLVLLFGFIPRGRGRATTPLRPQGLAVDELRGRLGEIGERVRRLGPRLGELEHTPGRFRHLIFGGLTGAQWHRFLAIHHHHHLKIIRDVRSALVRGPKLPA
jgi:hypothetical protein